MAKKSRIEFEGFEEVIARLNKIGGNTKQITEKALKETHKHITKLAEEGIQTANLPAKGEYQSKEKFTENSLVREAIIEWAGTLGSVPVGFSIRKGGLASIFMIHGTPRHMKVQKLYTALSGKSSKTKQEVMKIQEEIFYNEIRRLNG